MLDVQVIFLYYQTETRPDLDPVPKIELEIAKKLKRVNCGMKRQDSDLDFT